MKKILAVLTLGAVCVAILFAQDAVQAPIQVPTVPVVAEETPAPAQGIYEILAEEMPGFELVVEQEKVIAETSAVPVIAEEIPAPAQEISEILAEEMPAVETVVEQDEVIAETSAVPVIAEETPAPAQEAPEASAEETPVVEPVAEQKELIAETSAVPVVAEEISAVVQEIPVASVVVEESPAIVQEAPAVSVEEEPVVVETAGEEEDEVVIETDVIGITDDMSAGAQISGGLISLSLKDVEIQDVVRLFSRLSNANIIVPNMVDEENPRRIDVNLDNVEWKPALQAILDTQGLELVEKIPGSEVYSIRERAADAPEPMEIKVFKLDYATVSEVIKMVNVMVTTKGGQISTYPARNSIVVQGTAKLINDIEQIVAAVDLPREQVFIEAKFLELSDSASEQLGIDWNVLGGYRAGINSIGGSYSYNNSRANNLNQYSDISGRPFELLETESDGEWVLDENSATDGDMATDFYEWFNGIDFDSRSGNNSALNRIFGVTPTKETIDTALVGKTLGATLTADDFNLVMSALKQMNGAKIVSNPKIIVANEQTATIHIGQKKPNIQGTIQTAGDSQVNRVYSLDKTEPYFEDGVKVDVTPTVNTEDNITIRIQPTLDRLDSDPTVAPDGTAFWGKSTKTIDTVFGLEDGQTAAIGGLTEASNSDVNRKVPLLGDLPFIGRLFSYSSKSSQQVETIIFVTVGMANPNSMVFETGLPEDSSLAMRHRTQSKTDRSIRAAELDILRAMETERLQERLRVLQDAEAARLEAQQK